MAIICRDLRLIFIMVPGTGCSVIGQELRKRYGAEWLPASSLVREGKVVLERKHNTLEQLLRHGCLSPDEKCSYMVVATVRNPFDRFATYYQRLVGSWTEDFLSWSARDLARHEISEGEREVAMRKLERKGARLRRRARIVRGMGFNNWMKGMLLRSYLDRGSETLMEIAFPMLGGVQRAIRFESLEAGLNEILSDAGVRDRIDLPRRNVTPEKRPYREYYSRVTRRMVETALEEPLARFGYSFDGPTGTSTTVRLS